MVLKIVKKMNANDKTFYKLRHLLMAVGFFFVFGSAAYAQHYPEMEVQFDLNEKPDEAETYVPSLPDGVEIKGRILMIIEDDFNDTEVFYPLYRLVEEGYEVTVATLDGGKVTGYNSAPIEKTIAVKEVNPEEYAALYIPGGKAPEKLKREEAVLDIVREFNKEGKLIGAICHGPQILASAGLIEGKEITAYPELYDEMRKAGANFVDRPVVVDENLITARVPGDLPAHLHQFIDALDGDFASDVEESLQDAGDWLKDRYKDVKERFER